MRKAEELRALTEDDLWAEFRDASKAVFELTNELAVARKLEKPHELKQRKKDRARILTIINEKQRQKGSQE